MISYFIYHCFQTPFLLIPSHKLKYEIKLLSPKHSDTSRWMFLAKTILVPPMAISMVVYLAVKAGTGSDFFNTPATVSGSERAWLWLSSMTAVTGGFSTLVRYAIMLSLHIPNRW